MSEFGQFIDRDGEHQPGGNTIAALRSFIDARWEAARGLFDGVSNGPVVPLSELTQDEAGHFLASVATGGLFEVSDDRLVRTDRLRPKANGQLRAWHFFE